jgi:hypothetical protein
VAFAFSSPSTSPILSPPSPPGLGNEFSGLSAAGAAESRALLRRMWAVRLQGCQRHVDVWQDGTRERERERAKERETAIAMR